MVGLAAAWLLKSLGRTIRATAAWAYRSRANIANWIFRGLTLLSVGYLVYDRLYETEATIVSPFSDPKNPFVVPFSIQNNSHLFAIKNVRWICEVTHMRAGGTTVSESRSLNGSVSEIGPGKNLNIPCNFFGPTSHVIKVDKMPVVSDAEMLIAVEYDASFFGLYDWHHTPPATRFTWASDASNPQWIRGDFAE